MLTGPPVDHNQPDKRFYLVVFASLELKRGCVCLNGEYKLSTRIVVVQALPRYIIRRRRIYSFEVVYDKIRGFGEIGRAKTNLAIKSMFEYVSLSVFRWYYTKFSQCATAVTSKKLKRLNMDEKSVPISNVPYIFAQFNRGRKNRTSKRSNLVRTCFV